MNSTLEGGESMEKKSITAINVQIVGNYHDINQGDPYMAHLTLPHRIYTFNICDRRNEKKHSFNMRM